MSGNQPIAAFGEGHHKTYPKDEVSDHQKEPFHEGKHSHEHMPLDSKDQRSIKNKLAAAEHDELEKEKHAHDPEPQHYKEHEKRGKVIDEQLEEEDEEKVKEMDGKKAEHHHHGHEGGHSHKHGHESGHKN